MLNLEQRLLEEPKFFDESVQELVIEIFLSDEIHSKREFQRIKNSIKAINKGENKPTSFYDYLIQILPVNSQNPIIEYIVKNPSFFKDEELNDKELKFQLKSDIGYPHTISGLKYTSNNVLHKVFTKIREMLADRKNLEDLVSRYKEEKDELNNFDPLPQYPPEIVDSELLELFRKTIEDTCEFTSYYLEIIDKCNKDVKKLFSRISPLVGSYVGVQQVLEIQSNKDVKNSSVQKLSPIEKYSIKSLTDFLVNMEEEQRNSIRRRLENRLVSHTHSNKSSQIQLGFELASILFPQLDIESYISENESKFSKTKKFELCGLLSLIRSKFRDSRTNDVEYRATISNALKIASSYLIQNDSQKLLLTYNP